MNDYVVILRLGFPCLEWIPIHCKALIMMTQKKKIDLVMQKGAWEGSWIINLIPTVKYIVPDSLHLKVVQSPPSPPPPPLHDVARKPWIHYRVKAGIFVTVRMHNVSALQAQKVSLIHSVCDLQAQKVSGIYCGLALYTGP